MRDEFTAAPDGPDQTGSPQDTGNETQYGTSTGTTIVAVSADEGVVMATDRRASSRGFVANKDVEKVEAVHPRAAVAISGSVGGAQSFLRGLRSEATLYETRRGEPMSIAALSTFAGNLLRSNPAFYTSPLLGGVDSDGTPHVYDVDGAGGVMASPYAAGGSGMQLAYGTLESGFEDDLTMDEAVALARRAVRNASERDAMSGDGVVVARITTDGVSVTADGESVDGDAATDGEVA